MRLPNAEEAIIAIEKLRDYCLNPEHPRGKHKARVFKSSLGLGAEDADELKKQIERKVLEGDCEEAGSDQYGRRYTMAFEMKRGDRAASIRTGWIIRTGEEMPRLTSCYVEV